MKIDGTNPIESRELYGKVQDSNKPKGGEKSVDDTDSKTSKDKFSMSGRAREINELKEAISNIPDVREEKVEQVKKAIDTGNYNFDSMKVAEKILEEI